MSREASAPPMTRLDLKAPLTGVLVPIEQVPGVQRRLLALPGIGEMKARALIAIVGRRLGVKPPGWDDVAPTVPTLGDVETPEDLARYQEGKRAAKAAARAAKE